jgi:hypothetical protein
LKNVDLRFEAADPRPALIASAINGFALDGFKSRGTTGSETLRLEKIDNLSVRKSPGLKERAAESVESTLKE